MKSRATSRPVSCFRELAPRAFSWPSTFVSSKPLQVSYPEASEFFGIAPPRLGLAVEVALQQERRLSCASTSGCRARYTVQAVSVAFFKTTSSTMLTLR